MTKLYNHAFTIAFSLTTPASCEGEDYPAPGEIREALYRRIKDLDDDAELMEAIGTPFDSYVEDEGDEAT